MIDKDLIDKTSQASWGWKLSKGDRTICFRNLLCEDDYVYYDNDRSFDLYLEYDTDMSNHTTLLRKFFDYAAAKLDMTKEDRFHLFILAETLNWNYANTSIDIIDNDVPKDMHEFLVKYNFRLFISGYD